MTRRSAVRLALPVVGLALATACATTKTTDTASSVQVGAHSSIAAELRLGYFANVTHASAVYGVGAGTFQKDLGTTKLKTQVFNAGPTAVEALFAGSLDAAFVGPSPAINAFVKSRGEAVRIVAGATSGGASLVVRPDITSAVQLRGRKLADPQTGGTQDVALRTYLGSQGVHINLRGGGDATIIAQENSQTLQVFKAGQIDGAWAPEPWASRLVVEGGGRVLVDEKSLWPKGEFVSTHLIVRTAYLTEHPDAVKALIQGELDADKAIAADPAAAKAKINDQLGTLTGKKLAPAVLDRAFSQITLTMDPLAASLQTSADHAFATDLIKKADLHGVYDLSLLRQVLGKPVDDAGLGASS